MDEVKDSRKLEGKTNFVSWKREFERAARTNDIFEYLTGEEMVPSKPRKEDYFEKPVGIDTRRLTRAMSAQAQTTTPSTEGDADIYDTQAMVSTNDSLRWQIELKEYEKAKEKMKLAGKLLDSWVCEGIKIEIEEFADAKKAYDFIKRRYAVTHERARDDLLNVLHELEQCYSHRYKSLFAQICVSLLTHPPRAGHHSPILCDQPATVNSNATE
ncbi:hypothetical protein VFPPC_18540 [Pochonia chlamydosporia 170]|uniref:Uncharacterized protein n=1 Tax=Pochonia chlamydosporia 170 TaxID=1380566 RepID=A0A179EYG3_METCM|nr:hypothetical protein VFPPC_12581 [Pochonia chlamydosporia 170]XP_022284885.1 hypothetical protein VFPPC_18540 [Pochonia chlamydosporia 170]OAQ57873.2 hypothetical protein VFPPC_12581 [Pochonia chlamydosporia 170]OWT42351.1 hypothetical protein VFPPC_18540 [Pochonia chlamydosporia 170]